jgi:uncharacterized protein
MISSPIPWQTLRAAAAAHDYPLLFATVSGAHLYGFPSPDSDFDLRGAHILPARECLSLLPKRETLSSESISDGIELDLVTHDAAKFFRMLLTRNGYVLEQLHSPLVVQGGPWHEELLAIAPACVTRHHAHHYLGFAATQWGLFEKEQPPRVKPLLYVFRVLLTGIWLMRTGRVEANLMALNEEFRLPYVPELVRRKVEGTEQGTLDAAEVERYRGEFARLVGELEGAAARTELPGETHALGALDDLLMRVRGV